MTHLSVTLKKIMRLAQKEREFLLAGDIESLVHLEPKKERLIRQVKGNSRDIDAQDLQKLRQTFVENDQLYRAALGGIRRVKEQVASLINGQKTEFQTYARDGNRTAVTRKNTQVERKA